MKIIKKIMEKILLIFTVAFVSFLVRIGSNDNNENNKIVDEKNDTLIFDTAQENQEVSHSKEILLEKRNF